ncbi:MAG: hypothetical protein EOM52_03160, partial [Clostridia bacterium]|nr:hypothetical protein [Clostridia bacterium]
AALLIPAAPAQGAADLQRKEFRAMWVASVYNLDYPSSPTADPAKLKAEADSILQTCADLGMTAVILQVRPSADALYRSDLYPWSKYLTGAAGTAPQNGFDPLTYWVDKAHALGLELHAWVNPFRVTKSGQNEFDALPASSPAKAHPDWVVQYEKNYYLDPGIPEVRELVIQGAEEIVRNYDVDGIHLDDYFYPGSDFNDAATFAKYGGGYSSIGDWRRDNVNALIRDLDTRLHACDGAISFGVSPSGVWRDKRNDERGSSTTGGFESWSYAYADSRKWVQEGWVDYICPQIYWYIGHKSMDYKTIANWWCDTVRGTGVKLYLGMADYLADDGKAGSPWYDLSALRAQLTLNRSLPEVSGEVHFRYKFFAANRNLNTFYKVWYLVADPVAAADFLSELPSAEQKHWAAPYYSVLGAGHVINGYPDGSFRPDGSVSRGEMSKLVFSALPELKGETLPLGGIHPFADLSGHWSENYVAALVKAGYLATSDYPDAFGADTAMKRAEVVKLLICALGYDDDGTVTSSRFPDVTSNFYYVEKAVELGVVEGMDDGVFAPDSPVTRGQAAAMLLRAIELNG